jgi:hypothetical protein
MKDAFFCVVLKPGIFNHRHPRCRMLPVDITRSLFYIDPRRTSAHRVMDAPWSCQCKALYLCDAAPPDAPSRRHTVPELGKRRSP